MSHPRAARIIYCLLLSCLAVGLLAAQPTAQKKKRRAVNPALTPIVDQPQLPRVLLIGDSISMGYTVPVRKLLAQQANVHRPSVNCGATTVGLQQIDQWLGDRPWAVIHFNWGLHDLKYVDPKGTLADPSPTSHQLLPPSQYEENLRKLVERLKKTGAQLIWCSTTPVPLGAAGRVSGDEVKYNAIAARIMQENGVATDDLYAFAKARLERIQLPANVHFTPSGYEELAGEVARSIRNAMQPTAKATQAR
jgi:hypothetical protein